MYVVITFRVSLVPPANQQKILEARLMFYNDGRTFHAPLPIRVADLLMPIVQGALTQVKEYTEGTFPATTWMPAVAIRSWQRSRVDGMVRLNIAAQHARQMEAYLDPALAPDIFNYLQQEYNTLR